MSKRGLLTFKSCGEKQTDDGKCVDHGDISALQYELYQRGSTFTVLHILDPKHKDLCFKKDISTFQAELDKIKFDKMAEDDHEEIKGSGDNDDLVFTMKSGEIVLSLKKRGFDVIDKLKDILQGKGAKHGS
jgi:hypothetical protein